MFFRIVIIAFTLILDWSEVVQETNSYSRKAHVVPELLAELAIESFYCFAFDEHLLIDKEVHKMLVLDFASFIGCFEVVFLNEMSPLKPASSNAITSAS